jgi:hypothetical protein
VGYLVDNDTDEECGEPQESFRFYGSTGIPIGHEHQTTRKAKVQCTRMGMPTTRQMVTLRVGAPAVSWVGAGA